MRVLITGGAGFIGSHVADPLLSRGDKVRVFDSLEPQIHGSVTRPGYLAPEVEFIRGDVQDRASLFSALEGVDGIFHFAAMVGVGQSQYEIARYTAANTLGTAVLPNILANERHAVRKIVVGSSMSVYGEGAYRRPSDGALLSPRLRTDVQLAAGDFEMRDPDTGEPSEAVPTPENKPLLCESIYALNKKDQEEYCLLFGRTYGLPTVACRFFNVYGARQSLNNPYTGAAAIFMSRIKNGKPPLIYEDGLQNRDFIDVHDIARGCVMAMEDDRAEGKVFNLATGRRTSIVEMARMLIDLLGMRLHAEIIGRHRKGDIRHCYADTSRAEGIGFRAEISLTQGLRDLKEWSGTIESVDLVDVAHDELTTYGLITGGTV